jgi:hypothetical protein
MTVHAAGPAPLEVTGVPMGVSMAELKSKIPGFQCTASSCTLTVSEHIAKACGGVADSACAAKERDKFRFGTVQALYYEAEFRDDRLGKMFVRVGRVEDDAVAQLTDRYGKPSHDVSTPFLSKTGPGFTNRTLTWLLPDGKLFIKQPYGSIDEAAVIVTSQLFEAAAAKDALDRKSSVQGN